MKHIVTHEEANTFLEYDEDSGVFVWRKLPTSMFANSRCCAMWNGRFFGKKAGSVITTGYLSITIKGKHYAAHRLAWFMVYREWPSSGIDHINGDILDNRIKNLRVASQAENTQNQKKFCTNKSGFPGVSWDKKKKKWSAHITCYYKHIFLGYFDNPKDAGDAYLAAKEKYHSFNPVPRATVVLNPRNKDYVAANG